MDLGFGLMQRCPVLTVTTVGYGDKYPVSPEGKAVAITLMILGIAIFGLVSAST